MNAILLALRSEKYIEEYLDKEDEVSFYSVRDSHPFLEGSDWGISDAEKVDLVSETVPKPTAKDDSDLEDKKETVLKAGSQNNFKTVVANLTKLSDKIYIFALFFRNEHQVFRRVFHHLRVLPGRGHQNRFLRHRRGAYLPAAFPAS